MLRFSIITPTLQRQSLVRACKSVDTQTYENWQHIIIRDCAPEDVNDALTDQISSPADGRRIWITAGKFFHNWGNTPRWQAWKYANGDYLLYLDCDNALYSDHSLADIATALKSASLPDFAIFPIHRHGRIFFHDPPGMCMTDTANVVARREIGRWPDIVAREADGEWVERMKLNYKYAAFPNVEPIVLMEYSSNGI